MLPDRALITIKEARGWRGLALYLDIDGGYRCNYRGIGIIGDDGDGDDGDGDDGDDDDAFNVFTHRDGRAGHFWSAERGTETADLCQDQRGAPDLTPSWTILDAMRTSMRCEGQATDCYPELDYPA